LKSKQRGQQRAPDGFARLAAFLCPEVNEYITGVEIAVNGRAVRRASSRRR
jgi:hypothetical protein